MLCEVGCLRRQHVYRVNSYLCKVFCGVSKTSPNLNQRPSNHYFSSNLCKKMFSGFILFRWFLKHRFRGVLLPLPFQILELSGSDALSSIHRLWMQHCNLLLVSNFCCAAAVSPLASATCKQGRKFKINFHFRCALSFQSADESCVERRKQRQNFFNSSEGRDAALNGSPRVLNFELRTWRLNLHCKEEKNTSIKIGEGGERL